MHIEVQVALNFVISYLYNKLPRRRVNIFGEELEKALKDKFQGHWYPEKPFKGSAFRCLKTGDPTDAVLDRAARESGVPISDILENLPAELAVWVDPGEVSYRIGEKGAVKILFSESNDRHLDDTTSADREVTKTFNPEAQCFRPIDAVNSSLNALSLSPKSSPHGSPPTSTSSPAAAAAAAAAVASTAVTSTNTNGYIKNISPAATTTTTIGNSFLPRSHAPITFTTATFAQTKFGSTKLKTNSKRSNSRMSPTEFSNYIKQRAMQQQLHHSHNGHGPSSNGHLGHMGPVSPARSLSPNPLSVSIMNGGNNGGNISSNGMPTDSYYYSASNNGSNIPSNMYSPRQYGRNNLFDTSPNNSGPANHFPTSGNNTNGLYSNGFGPVGNGGKYSSYLEPSNYYGMQSGPQHTNNMIGSMNSNGSSGMMNHANTNGHHQTKPNLNLNGVNGNNIGTIGNNGGAMTSQTPINSPGSNGNHPDGNNGSSPTSSTTGSKMLDGMNSFYSNSGPYQHLLVAN